MILNIILAILNSTKSLNFSRLEFINSLFVGW